ncbi:HD-GYP domain-containing protein [Clostridium akagii]|uniref:HD-GYP domain-containing protein n=1 Tax=Clostridium akagii TaxID=91623 RepID=UPI00047D9C34|nr:HD-GYP domain-containing protein [Clostridium akagii]
MRLVPIQCIKENDKLARNIYDNNGKLLLKSGIILRASVIKKIKFLNIYSVYVIDQYSDNIIEEIIAPEIRQKAIKAIKDKYGNLNNDDKIETKPNYKGSEEEYQSILYMAKQLIDEILSRKDVMLNVVDIKSLSNYLFEHSVNVAIISLIMGIRLNLHKFDLIDLCVGALLHDFGMVFVPKGITDKEESLTEEEYKVIRDHTRIGYEYLTESCEISLSSVLIALQHHERIGGQGYPEAKDGNNISKFAKIVAIADTYDALTSDRSYRVAKSPNEALEYIMANGGIIFDYKLVQLFSKIVVPYPKGTIVKLTNDEIGIVEKVSLNTPLRPQLKILYSKNSSRINEIIMLEKEIDIVIKGLHYE